MIKKCPADVSFNSLRPKCENATSDLSYPVEDFLPVVGTNSITYRNKYCALCNGVKNFMMWDLGVFTYVIPPEEFDFDLTIKFIVKNGGRIERVSPRPEQPRRFCLGRNYIDDCASSIRDQRLYRGCVDGPVELVTDAESPYTYFKNHACALCNGYRKATEWKTAQVCNPLLPEGFSVVYSSKDEKATTNIVKKYCPSGTVYDENLQFCRKGYIISSSGELSNEYLVLLWFKYRRNQATSAHSRLETVLKSALSSHFSLRADQISTMTLSKQTERNDLLVATFRITLTPFQTLVMANQNRTKFNISHENTEFLKLFSFSDSFTMEQENISFSVVKMITKQLSCYGEENFQPHEYKIDKNNGIVFINKTGREFSLSEYTLIEKNDGNITLCSKLILSNCSDGAYVPLDSYEYVIFPNLTVYHNKTRSTFNFGEYLIDTNSDKEHGRISALSKNSSISVCLKLRNTFNETETKHSRTTSSLGLRILTLICFTISIICLSLLFITYVLFRELRTVPGMNLMNLSGSMVVGDLIWLIGTTHFVGTLACEALAILEQYFLQVSFVAMSVISFHSWRVFSQPIKGRIANKSKRRFVIYSIIVWFAPAIFVAICVILDKTETFQVDYGIDCWLGTTKAKLFLFLLPLALSLLINICTFIQTAISLSRHQKNRQTLHRKESKQDLVISAKLATMVGFPWLFSFFGIMFPNEEAFDYLFVIFVCLQGLYIGMAFAFNKKTLKLYKDCLSSHSVGKRSSYATTTFEMARSTH
ncbi:uncharacterized protein LOC114535506 [Dendronephthya gigantea]|uniref:uncharacterized protein LOC114535506 n=1 Tax=Dendronephthya gigantea TaxID=151771 RepID=UPI00106AB7DA|nr:uncharacterized protein LOC114535506 [Dendronephthya gigantea]